MEKKHKNFSVTFIEAKKVPSLAVSISWKCSQANWYTLQKVKKGYNTNDPQFAEGGNSVALCYSLYQRLKERRVDSYNDAKYPIDCICCNVNNGYFQICYSTANKLSYLKRTLKDIVKELDPSKTWKQYAINIRNLGGKANREEFNWCVAELNKSLKDEICVVAAGAAKMVSSKQGKPVSASDNLTNLAKYLSDLFPSLADSSPKSKPATKEHKIPEDKKHYFLKLKSNSLNIDSMLVADYISKALSIRATPVDDEVIVWTKDPKAKLKSIKKTDRIKREMLSNKNTNELIVYHALQKNCAVNKNVVKFYRKNASKDSIAKDIASNL
jgi:hypothetical protein